MKIRIIGGSGTGKTYLAGKLSEKYGIERYDLDDVFWDNSGTYGIKRPEQKRTEMLDGILEKENWIIEGVYYAWCGRCFEEADRIYLLNVPRRVYRRRIILRFIKRKLGMEKGKKETLKSLKDLLKWADKYQREDMPQIEAMLEQYSEKTERSMV